MHACMHAAHERGRQLTDRSRNEKGFESEPQSKSICLPPFPRRGGCGRRFTALTAPAPHRPGAEGWAHRDGGPPEVLPPTAWFSIDLLPTARCFLWLFRRLISPLSPRTTRCTPAGGRVHACVARGSVRPLNRVLFYPLLIYINISRLIATWVFAFCLLSGGARGGHRGSPAHSRKV